MIDGILLIDKEEGKSSYFAIKQLKPFFPRKYKIGHAGTLDPFATGLLIILIGKATKLMNTIHKLEKEYEVTAEFGYATDTQDCTGTKINTKDILISQASLESMIAKKFIGNISQTPPLFSAKQINGERAYELARQGKQFELAPKEISVKKFEIIKYEWPFVTFKITCSTGTYVRTLIDELGKKVGTYATAVALRRTKIGPFDVKDSIPSESINPNTLNSIIELDKVNEVLNNEQR
jgi:tRNA pseudouridine55 synthase